MAVREFSCVGLARAAGFSVAVQEAAAYSRGGLERHWREHCYWPGNERSA